MIEETSRSQGWDLVPHSPRQIQSAVSHFDGIYDPETQLPTRPLTSEETRFIQNERRLCALDFTYYCNTPDAPIWLTDFSFKPLGEIKVGDEVMGWEKVTGRMTKKGGQRNYFVRSLVLEVRRRKAPVNKVTMSSGRVIFCTPDHLWSNGGWGATGVLQKKYDGRQYHYSYPWTHARVGARLRFAVTPVSRDTLSPKQKDTALWLGGIYDGEGSVSHNCLQIAQSKQHNPDVHQAIGQALSDLGFDFQVTDIVHRLRGGLDAFVKFCALCRPIRLNKPDKFVFSQVWTKDDRVVSVEPCGEREVVSLKTTTGNYVAWGYLSKNCHYAHIVAWDKSEIPFSPNVAQAMVLDVWSDLERRSLAIMMLQLKSRQLGVTTLTELAVAHRVQFHQRTNAVVASADPKKSVKMARMIKFTWEQMPWWLLPTPTKIEHGMPVEFGEINSSLLIQAGNQFNGIARGDTPNVAHLSELLDFPDPELLIDAALLNAIHETPDVFVILESTAQGRGNYLHKKWLQTKESWDRGAARLCPIFLPWFVGTDIHPTPTWLRAHPIPSSWVPADHIIAHAEKARQYVLANPLLLTHLAHGDTSWQLPRNQMWWYETSRNEAVANSQLNLFLAESPADDHECFQSTNISVFSAETTQGHRDRIKAPLGCYTITGTGIPRDLIIERRLWDSSKPPIVIKASDILKTQEVFQFIPIKFEGYSGAGSDPGLKLFIWEEPQPDQVYGLGVDTSDGVGLDWSVIEVLKKQFPHGPDQQVAEFSSPYIKALQLWPMALALGCYYSVHQSQQNRRKQVRVAIECRGNGESVQWEMQKRGWSNFHPWKKLDNKKALTPDKTHKIGVYTNSWYRPMMLDRLLSMLEEGSLDIRSPYFVDEMEALEKDEYKQSLKSCFGEHDDRIMALGFILDSLHVDDRPYGRSAYTGGVHLPPQDDPPPLYATYQQPMQAMDLGGRQSAVFIRGQQLGRLKTPRLGLGSKDVFVRR